MILDQGPTLSNAQTRVAIVISGLGLGGAERAAVHLVNALLGGGYSVDILTFESNESYGALETGIGAPVHRLGLLGDSASSMHAVSANRRRIAALHEALSGLKVDVVVSFVHTTNVLTILAMKGTSTPLIVCEESDPSSSPSSRAWRLLRWLTYRAATRVVVRTDAAKLWFGRRLQLRIVTVPNAVAVPADQPSGQAEQREKLVLSVGRLGPEKGYDLLVKAFSLAGRSHPEWRLLILGEGRERARLENQIAELNLQERVALPGIEPSPWLHYRRAQIFVSSSRHEGFGIALCEAMASGCAVIATDCPSGPKEIVEDGVDGSGDAEVTAADDGAETDRPSPSGLWLVGALVALGVIIGTIVVTRSSREEPDD